MVTVPTLTSVLDQMTVSREQNAGIQWAVTDAFAKLAISVMVRTATRVSVPMKSSVEKMNNVSARLASIANVKRASSESLLTIFVKIRTSVVRICTFVQ